MDIQQTTIAGIPVIFAPLPAAHSTTLQVLVKAGSIYEQKHTNGLSHFLEHMFFKGGKKYPTPKDVAATLDAIGADFNAFTSEEHAGYYVKCAPEYLPVAFDVLSDMLVDAQFPQDEMEREKQVVIQEIAMYDDMPQQLALDKRRQRYYGDTSYGRSVLGPAENIRTFTRDDLFAHQEALYTKDNLVIIVSGQIDDTAALSETISQLFGKLPANKLREKPLLSPAHFPEERHAHFHKETQQNHLVISAKGWSMHNPEKYAASLMSTILGGSMSSRLFMEIREKRGLCYYIGSRHWAQDEDGVFVIRAGIEKERWEEGLEAIYAELARIATGDINDTEYANALGHVVGKTKMGIETSEQLAGFVATQWLFKGKIESLDEMLAHYQAVTRDHIAHAAKKLADEHLYAYRIQ